MANGLLSPSVSLADQLRAQWGGDWNISGIDRANELAGILQSKGVTSLDGLKFVDRPYQEYAGDVQLGGDQGWAPQGEWVSGGGAWNESSGAQEGGSFQRAMVDKMGRALDFGGVQIGNFGDQGKGDPNDWLGTNSDGAEFGWSSAGHGATGYTARPGPDGRVQIVPGWNSSSDAKTARQIAMGVGTVLSAGALGGAFAGAGAAEAGGSVGLLGAGGADAATSAAWANGAAGLGGDTLSAMSGGGMLGQVGGMAGEAASWMKANPALGKLLMSGGMGLLSSSGGGSGGAQAPVYGPAKQWSSPIQQGIQSNPQQMNPAPIQQRPAGLLAQGQQNDGAWRYLKGQ